MLRITIHDDPRAWTLQLEGKLAGPWVREAEDCWQRRQANRPRSVLRVDLTGVTMIDAAGKAFLAAAHTQGAELVATGCLMRAIVAELARACRSDSGCGSEANKCHTRARRGSPDPAECTRGQETPTEPRASAAHTITEAMEDLSMNTVPDRAAFESFYAGKAPWDIGKPQQPFVAAADRVVSPVLDAGCGTGDTALFLAGHGLRVAGIDFVEEAIDRARRKAVERGLPADFLVKDALTLGDWDQRFASVIDSGLFHVFADEPRRRYVQGLRKVVEPGGRLFLMCFSDAEPGTEGPRRVSRQELDDAFADGWVIESVQPARFEINPAFQGIQFSEGGPKAWFAVVQRKG
jgi:SAM-dependent methyltransferase